MVLNISGKFRALKLRVKELIARHPTWREVAISCLCGLVLVVAAFPEVVFLGASLRGNDQLWPVIRNPPQVEEVNIFPLVRHRHPNQGTFDQGGAWLQSEPSMEFIRVSVQDRESPYWNPYSASGALGPETLVDNKFAIVNWIYAIFGGGQRLFSILFLSSVWLAATCMHRFLRGLFNLPQVAAWAGATFFIFNGYSIANIGSNVTWGYYFLPACLLACCRLIEQASMRRLAFASISIAAALSFTFISTTSIGLLAVAAVCLCFLFGYAKGARQIFKGFLSLCFAGIVGFFLVAAIYMPIVENMLLDSSDLVSYTNRPFSPAVHWVALLSLFSSSHFFESYVAFWQPVYSSYHSFHYASASYHMGVVAIIFATYAFFKQSESKLYRLMTWGSLAIMLIFLMRIFGFPGYAWLITRFPVLGILKTPYLWAGVMVPCTILVAFGLKNIASEKLSIKEMRLPLVATFTITIGLCVLVYYMGAQNPEWVFHNRQRQHLIMLAIFMVVSIILIELKIRDIKYKWSKVLSGAFVLLLVLNLFSEFKAVYFVVPDFFKIERPAVQFVNENAGYHRALGLGPFVPIHPERTAAWRVYGIGSTNLAIPQAYEELYFSNIKIDPSQRWSLFITTENVQDTPDIHEINTFFLDMIGVKYIMLPDSYVNYSEYWEERGFIEAAHFPGYFMKVYENPYVWPRAFLLPKEYLPASSEMRLEPELRDVLHGVDIVSYHHAEVTMQGNAVHDGVVVLTDNWHSNWRATLNGEDVDIVKVHATFRGVFVPEGDFVITMSYRPSTLNTALVLTGLGLSFCFIGILMPKRIWSKAARVIQRVKLSGKRFISFITGKIHSSMIAVDAFDTNPKKQYLHCSVTLFLIFFIIFVLNPVAILANSMYALSSNILLISISACLVASLVMSVIVFLLRRKYIYAEIILTSILLLFFINATIFPFQTAQLDGRELFAVVGDNLLPLVRNIGFFLVFIVTGLLFRMRIRFLSFVLLFICVGLTTYYHFNTLHNTRSESIEDKSLILQSAATFSSSQNVIVIVMDMLQGTAAEKAFYENPEYLEIFDGFTLFTRSFSSFPFTSFTLATIQSGNLYSSDKYSAIENHDAATYDSFMTDFQNKGGRVEALALNLPQVVPSVHNLPESIDYYERYQTAIRASIARISGYWPRSLLSNEIHPIQILNSIWGNIAISSKTDSVDLHRYVVDNFNVGDDTPKMLYFWNGMLHAPIIFDRFGGFNLGVYSEGQAYTELSYIEEILYGYALLKELFETMKDNDVWDNSLILLLSDHGHATGSHIYHLSGFPDFQDGHKLNGNIRAISWYNTMLFVKPPFARGEPVISHNAAWNGDVRCIIRHYMNDFTNDSPIEVIESIRDQKPNVEVMFVPALRDNEAMSMRTSAVHQHVTVTNLFEISGAFSAKSGITDD
jgi:hypothetical protein